jgi:hypothetical protein
MALPTVVSLLVDLALEGQPVVLRCPALRPEEVLALLMFRRAWPVGIVVCHFERRTTVS